MCVQWLDSKCPDDLNIRNYEAVIVTLYGRWPSGHKMDRNSRDFISSLFEIQIENGWPKI